MPSSARARYDEVVAAPSDIRRHLPRLRREARGTVLELGVREGNSTTALLAGVEERGGTVWSVDVDPACAQLFAGHPQWRFVRADSRDPVPPATAGLPPEIDVLFVDTLHTPEHVREELAVWGDRVVAGGLLAFHDTDSAPDIRTPIVEWCERRHVPYEFLGGSNGLGLAYPGRGGAFAARVGARRQARRIARGLARRGRRLRTHRS